MVLLIVKKTYHNIDSHLRHIRRVHPVVHANEVFTSGGNETDADSITAEQIAEDENANHSSETVPAAQREQNIEQVLGLMILKWREKYQLPKTWLSNLLEDVSYIVSGTIQCL